MRLAALGDNRGVFDFHHGLRIADERVGFARQQPAEGRELHVILLQRSRGEQQRHRRAFTRWAGRRRMPARPRARNTRRIRRRACTGGGASLARRYRLSARTLEELAERTS